MTTAVPVTISFKVASERYGVAESTLRAWARQGRLPAYRVAGTRIRLRVSDIENLFEPIHSKEM